jgi:tRNA 2-thiouridine synthesizing protein A
MSETLQTQIKQQAEIHRVLSNPSRLHILHALRHQEHSVGELAEQIGASLQNTSQHLRLMKDKGILEARRDGKTIYYQIAGSDIGGDCKQMLSHVETISTQTGDEKMTDLNAIESAKVVDARAMACPGPLLEAKKSIGGVKVGEILEIWSGDANTKGDMPRWCEKVGHEYLGDLTGDGYDRLFIRRKK